MNLQEFIENGSQYFIPNLSIDIVIIGYQDNTLKCLLLKKAGKWFLPGGYVAIDESVDDAAARILSERTGLVDLHLKFLSVFGDRSRQFSEELQIIAEKSGLNWDPKYWVNQRFVSLTYYSLVHIDTTNPETKSFDDAAAWFSFEELPRMWLDHISIVLKARQRLKEDIQHEQMTYKLLPDQFTMPDLHRLHQTIIEEEMERSRFQKKMLASGRFERLPKLQKNTPGSNPYQYRIKNKGRT